MLLDWPTHTQHITLLQMWIRHKKHSQQEQLPSVHKAMPGRRAYCTISLSEMTKNDTEWLPASCQHSAVKVKSRFISHTYIPPSSWPRRRSSPRRWWGRCCRSRWSSGWSWWNTERWCTESLCQGRPPIGQNRWRCSGKAIRCWWPADRASCPSWWCWWPRRWPRSLRCCTCWGRHQKYRMFSRHHRHECNL